MNDQLVSKIKANPNYQELVKKRTSFAIKLGIFVLVLFYAFILTIAFEPALLGIRTGDGVMTIAFPIAAAIIVISFFTTLIYVKRANGEFEELIEKVREDVKDEL
ncbi:hypothetical protein CP965_13635 [Halarcobacter mediterraneus]|uniref:DUF485 domain-containing protein n=1 Tax=Halarcobacter mediterraneus TaxID=2023153 RepID=A0A4Q1B149_9BACT|nr:DUF485 domain-containing protein [Halarcobacter mediterraneus]RXK11478.1 hypothetical protein CP965_13635 [Halarcobacter mediterraneus]|eukprot:gnl/Chilomastix_cuspidata/8012.p2 GENE.gnl/Chilomastix_cuspidata/8012~~gnl/Chilomastix_cuspidata/8012.p2  ORF type:complete len:105 (-),score=1.70 gnl/Chilomastix_cuspidata/8012:1748-2062(-)